MRSQKRKDKVRSLFHNLLSDFHVIHQLAFLGLDFRNQGAEIANLLGHHFAEPLVEADAERFAIIIVHRDGGGVHLSGTASEAVVWQFDDEKAFHLALEKFWLLSMQMRQQAGVHRYQKAFQQKIDKGNAVFVGL